MHSGFGASLICMRNGEGSVGARRHRDSQWQHMGYEGKIILPEFYKYVQPFLLAELPPRKAAEEDALALVAMQRGAARGWHCWMTATKMFGFFSGHLVTENVGGSAGRGSQRLPPLKGVTSQWHIASLWDVCLNLFWKHPGEDILLPRQFFLSVQNHS